jgi:hypothetical protein
VLERACDVVAGRNQRQRACEHEYRGTHAPRSTLTRLKLLPQNGEMEPVMLCRQAGEGDKRGGRARRQL